MRVSDTLMIIASSVIAGARTMVQALAFLGKPITAGSLIAIIVPILLLVAYVLNLLNAQRGQRYHEFFYLHEYLAKEDLSTARWEVRTRLYRTDYSDWEPGDKETANRVCSSYDQAGILITKALTPRMRRAFLNTSWGESICDQYEALRDFLSHRQTPWKTGKEFFRHFDELYRLASRHHRKGIRIISGGQTGADRAALDAAIKLGLLYGGWVPKGGWAEDCPYPPGLLANYPKMWEAQTCDPAERTRLNVLWSHATLILTKDSVDSPGTKLTWDEAKRLGRPSIRMDVDNPKAAGSICDWLCSLEGRVNVLNIAGPREGEAPGLYKKASSVLETVLSWSSKGPTRFPLLGVRRLICLAKVLVGTERQSLN